MKLFVPEDNDLLAAKYESIGGTCGPSTIAVAEEIKVQDVLNKWLGKGESAFRGFSPIAEMKEMLKIFGYNFKYVRAHKAKEFPIPNTDTAILRIQWLKEDGTEYYWRAAGAHTHYVLMKKVKLNDFVGRWIFCNYWEWFYVDSPVGRNYLKEVGCPQRGYVSSYLELTKSL